MTIKGLDRYLTSEPEDYTHLYEAIYEQILLPDNNGFDRISEPFFDNVINKVIYEEWSVAQMVILAKRYYSIYWKKILEPTFWYFVASYEPDDIDRVVWAKCLWHIENLEFREMLDSAHISTFYKITDQIKTRKERDRTYLFLHKLKCEYSKKCLPNPRKRK